MWVMGKAQTRLSIDDRESIASGLARGMRGAEIARSLGRDPSVVNREIARNGGPLRYSCIRAHSRAGAQKVRASCNKIADNAALEADVLSFLRLGSTPKQIEVALRRKYPNDPTRTVSHETIYDYIYVHARGSLKKELISLLRSKKPKRYPAPRKKSKLSGSLPGAVNIRDRPKEAEGRQVPGHWEADLIMGEGNRSAMLVVAERSSRLVVITNLKGKKSAEDVNKALKKTMMDLPDHLKKSLTYDNGREMAKHAEFTLATDMRVYFCDPHSPWQRGAIENINRLLREYFPKGIDFNDVKPSQVAHAQYCLNNRPRIVLEGASPLEVYNEFISKDCALVA